jgi:hypothetical protein
MLLKTAAATTLLGSALGLFGAAPTPQRAAATIKVDIATLHAAALTKARASGDASDGAYLLVSIVGPGTTSQSLHLPDGAHVTLQENQAIPPMKLSTLTLEPGDSVRVIVSILEADQPSLPEELQAAVATTAAMAQSGARPSSDLVTTALAPLTALQAHWIGSASLLLTNEGGTAHWRGFDCLKSCSVLQPVSDGTLAESATQAAGVVELSGSSGTYHMQVAMKRTS